MKKNTFLFIIAITGLFSCKQGRKSTPETVKTETINSVRKYEYADSRGKRVIIHNSLPRGTAYTDPEGKEYFKVIFWTRISNETDHSLELKIAFPAALYEAPGLPGNSYKILVPPDTMTIDKDSLYDYGMRGLPSFLDATIHEPTSLKRTIKPKESTGFYIVLLSLTKDITPGGILRTGLILKGQDLFYSISRYASKVGHPLLSNTEIHCGRINLKDLVFQK